MRNEKRQKTEKKSKSESQKSWVKDQVQVQWEVPVQGKR